MASAQIEQDVGGVADHELAGFQERRRKGRRALRLHHLHHRRHAVAARDVVIIGAGILQCEADIFAASLDEGPVIEGVFHGCFPGRFPASACSAALTNLQQTMPEPPVPLAHSINFNANRQRVASFQLVFAPPHNPLTEARVAFPVHGGSVMREAATYAFISHQLLVLLAGAVCLFGTWVGMRHFARARATEGAMRTGWLFMASVGTGAALWAATFISILALDPLLASAFEPVATGLVLIIAIIACLAGFEIGSRHFTLAPETGGLVMGSGILAMHFVAMKGWHVAGEVSWNAYGLVMAFVLGLALSGLAVNRANRPVTRWCRHGAAIVLAFMVCTMHYTLTASASIAPTAAVAYSSWLIPAKMLGVAVVGAVLLVMGSGFSTYVIDLRSR